MTIAEICLSNNLGGLELYFYDCCRWFHESDQNLKVAVRKDSRLHKLCKQNGIPHISHSSRLELASWLRKVEADVVHVHHKKDLPATAIGRKLNKRYQLVHTRQMAVPKSKKDPYHALLYGQIDLLITITDLLKKECEQRIPISKDKIRRLYYGVPEPDRGIVPSKLNDVFRVGLFSRIEHQKGQHLVIEAAKLLLAKGIKAEFDLWGDVMDEQYAQVLKKQITLHELEKYIRFCGFNANPPNEMPNYDVILMPSKNETFGLVLAEAMRAEVATIGTRAGGVPEIIDHGENGLLFDWGNAGDLANQIEKLYLDSRFRKELACKGKEKADSMFNRTLHFKELQVLFSDVVKKSKHQ